MNEYDNSYYGRMSDDKPKQEVAYMMIDEMIEKIMEDRIDEFKKELSLLMKEFKVQALQDVKFLKDEVSAINKFIAKLKDEGREKVDDRKKSVKKEEVQ